jgi:hypothetical protein
VVNGFSGAKNGLIVDSAASFVNIHGVVWSSGGTFGEEMFSRIEKK